MPFKMNSRQLLLVLSLIIVHNFTASGWLLFPASTVLQITMSISVPVPLKDMKFFIDWGFQVNYVCPWLLSNFYDIPKWPGHSRMQTRTLSYDKYVLPNGTHPADASAGQVYMALEDLMISYGFHETCLLKSVCEVARHPFDLENENLIAEIFSFVLSPSMHNAFSEDERVYRSAYEAAERYGASGVDCSFMYPDCPLALIDLITKVKFG
ncbi:unnamed protein product [Hermetia illucens]|uniref:Uncharacterized protein n=2 Tax=Hermetia illucens TaxID=343691 RepID=A0A7R8UAZ0_HERIL|nr:unnamed protein product [Hermetia illucens]